MDDTIANNLAERALAIHKKKLDLLAKYYEKIKKATSPMIAARFLQVEYQISLLMDVEIASKTPMLPEKSQVKTNSELKPDGFCKPVRNVSARLR